MTSQSRRRSARRSHLTLYLSLLVAALSASGSSFSQASDPVPTFRYHAAIRDLFNEGDYDDALDQFQDELRGAMKTSRARWIDSICYNTMVGECYYRMGRLDNALDHYTDALRLYIAYSDWMIRVKFPPAIRASSLAVRIPWGTSTRGARIGQFPDSMLIGQGRVNNNEAIQQGGVVQQAIYMPIEVQEIVRTTALAIRRRTELLGPLAKFDPITNDLIAVLSRRPGPPNHWSQAWIDLQLGLALVAGGKPTEAILYLNRSVVAAGEFDHPLTATALLELGRLALLRGDYDDASKYFHEASISAVQFGDATVLEEAFRYGTTAHLLDNRREIMPVLAPAAQWARVKDLRHLRASLLVSAAENLVLLDDAGAAGEMLDEAELVIGRRIMGSGYVGARLNYVRATVLFQQRKTVEGNRALQAAMEYMGHGSRWLHQILQVDQRFATGQITPQGLLTSRKAMELYTELLRDPGPTDWAVQPMESLAVLVTPHSASLEHWFLIAIDRRAHEVALEITDRARRHRYFSTLSFGGRLQSLRWILEAPEGVLDHEAMLQRQNLMAQFPAYAKLSEQANSVKAELKKMPLVAADPDAARQQGDSLGQLASISLQQEAILREIAVRREAADLVFPPLRSTKEIQDNLPAGNVLLAFFAAGDDLYGFLLDRKNYNYWRVKGTPLLVKRIEGLLREMGHYEQNRQMTLDELSDQKWKKSAAAVLDALLDDSQADFTADFPELVIVPDGILWYLPFESLQVKVGNESHSLISRFRVRYSPTVSLSVPQGRGTSLASQTAVVLGRIYPRDDEEVAKAAYEQLAGVVPRTVALSAAPLPGPTSVYASLIDRLVVLDDIKPSEAGPYDWLPIQIDRAKPGNTLADWLSLPWEGPEVIVMPGFHTAAENALKTPNRTAPGQEVFLNVVGLMSCGARTMLISRWRTGGQTSFDVAREFTQELPHTSPADAWQRAVMVVSDSQLDVEAEPRVRPSPTVDAPKADHPFFWSGYMLVDSGVAVAEPGPPPDPAAAGRELVRPEDRAIKP